MCFFLIQTSLPLFVRALPSPPSGKRVNRKLKMLVFLFGVVPSSFIREREKEIEREGVFIKGRDLIVAFSLPLFYMNESHQ